MNNKVWELILNFFGKNFYKVLAVIVLLLATIIYLSKDNDISTPVISITGKKQEHIDTLSDKTDDNSKCSSVRDAAQEKQSKLIEQSRYESDPDRRINLKYWEGEMSIIQKLSCDIIESSSKKYLYKFQRADSLINKLR